MSATVDITTASRNETVTVPYSAIVIRSMNLDSLKMARLSGEQSSGSTVVNEVQAAEGDSSQMAMDDSVSTAETEREEIKGVFVIRDGKVEFVPVETGIADQKYIEVTEGIEPGDSVVSGPYRALRNVNDGDADKIDQTSERNRG
jgi:HlyD family secretion protein